MHHPGPPRFVATGDEVELAPRDPDPSATYTWRLTQAPAQSTVSLGDGPVEHLVPDAPGRYVVRLTAPDGEHDLTVRAFPGTLESSGTHTSGRSGGHSGGVSGGQSGSGRSGSGEYTEAGDGGDGGSGGGQPRLTLRPDIEATKPSFAPIAVPIPRRPRRPPTSPSSSCWTTVMISTPTR